MDDDRDGIVSIRLRLLGRSGLRVSELCLGTMTFGTEWGFGTDEAESGRIYAAYREAGGNFVDTANNYNQGTSEAILGRLIAGERQRIVLSTKFTFPYPTDSPDPNASGSHRKSLRHSLEGSLRRLDTDYVDLLWVHAWDECTPPDETMRALDDLVRAGKVLAIGVSNTPAWVAGRADLLAELRGWTTFCAMQVEYSLAERSADRELLPMARALGLGLLAWSPLGRGALSGKHDPDSLSPSQRKALDVASQVGREIGVTPAQVALAWVLGQGVTPVLGARRLDQIRDNLAVVDVRLTEEQLGRLEAATGVERGYPHDWLGADHRRALFSRTVIEQ
jgi:aryl-alcohol dehydrogenase-like predicted oxidoreductase